MLMILSLSLSSIFIIVISIFIYRRINYFRKFNIPHETLNILFGNAKKSTLGEWNIAYDIDRIYTKFKGKGMFAGFMINLSPYLLPLNAEVLKQILVTNFKNFRNNDFSFDTNQPTVISLNPFWSKNENWKTRRSVLSPAVTQSRLKAMYPLIDEAARAFTEHIRTELTTKGTSAIFDMREKSLKYSCNSIASTTYAINAQAYDDENTSELLDYGKKLWKQITLSTWLPSSPITREINQYFVKLMNYAVQRRRYNNDKRNDLLNYIIMLKDKKNMSEIETASHGMTFFLNGFETSSLALCYVLYELSKDKRVQDKLRMEINENLDAIDDDDDKKSLTMPIETLLNLTYLDQVFFEAVRLHPPLHYTTRLCNEEIELILDEQKILIPNGTAVLIPIYSIHHDPDSYENPHEFMPERFNEEFGGVKAFRDKCSLIPFGESARICLGMNLGMLQVKAAVVDLLRNFEFTCCESMTEEDVKLQPWHFSSIPSGKILMRFKALSG